MCGISGIYSTRVTEDHHKLIAAILANQTPRGPDHEALISIENNESGLILAHNRLSIIDLSAHANQPMWDSTGRYCIVYNGEIYNYIELRKTLLTLGLQFSTQSDTEVILNAFSQWGIDALQHFRGPFAFALYDREHQKLWLCRDRFGVRPLYYTIVNNTLYFASTTTVLAKSLNLKPNTAYLAKGLKYLVYEDNTDLSPYHAMHALPASSYLTAHFDANQLSCTQHSYYNLEEAVATRLHDISTMKTDTLLETVSHQLQEAVTIRLRTDVPLAISLSSGLDSSSIASLVKQQHDDTIGFSYGHPTDRATEGPLVANCADFLNIKMHYVWPTPNEMIEAFYHTINIQGAPFPTLSIVAQNLLYKKVRASGVKVLLGGQGGDEVFMGYRKFLLFFTKQLLREKRYISAFTHICHLLPVFLSEMTSLKAYWQQRYRYSNNTANRSISTFNLKDAPSLNLAHSNKPLWKRQLQDITQFSLPTLLRYEDRNAMGNSVESRLPYLDHPLVELGLALPETIKLREGYGKWAIRQIMKHHIPDSIRLARYKRGFDFPTKTLIDNGLGRSIRSTLQEKAALTRDYLNQSINIQTTFTDQQLLQQRTMHEAITLLWIGQAIT